MNKPTRHLSEIVDRDVLVAELTALYEEHGTGTDFRAAMLAHLKGVKARGHEAIERWLSEDGRGIACARRIATLQDVIIQAVYAFTIQHLYPADMTYLPLPISGCPPLPIEQHLCVGSSPNLLTKYFFLRALYRYLGSY